MSLTKVKAGNILLTTPSASSNDVTPATTAYVTTALANMVDSAPSTLNTLNELAAALGDDANFSTTVTNSIAAKAPIESPTFTTTITTPDINITGGSQIGQDYAYLKSDSTTTASLTLRKDSTGADSIDFLQLRSDGNGLIGKIEGDGDISFKNATFTGTVTSANIVSTSNTATQFKNATDTDIQHRFETNQGADFAIHRLIGSDGVDNKFIIGYGPNHGSTPNHIAIKNNHASGSIGFNTSATSTERMRIDSNGNVGIGATPKVTEAGWTNLSVGGQGALINSTSANAGGRTQLSNNVYVDESGNYSYISTDEASLYKQINGIHSWHTAASGSADAHITMSEKMRITSAGNVGIGTASPAAPLDVVSNSSAVGIELRGRSADNIGQLSFESNDSGTTYSQLQSLSTELKVKTIANIPMSFHTNNKARMVIKSNGGLQLNDDTSTSNRKEEVFHYKNVGTSYTDYFSVDLPSSHTAVFYEIITFGADWSGHSAARSYYKGFMSGTTGYSGDNEIENSGAYGAGSHIDWNYTRSGSTVTFQVKLYTGTSGLAAYIRIIGTFGNITLL